MTKNDINELLGGYGCFWLILIILACIFLLIPAIIFLGGLIWGCAVYALWNWVVVPVAGVPVLVYWWQCVICGVFITMLTGALKATVSK
jgi:hypothetical protein